MMVATMTPSMTPSEASLFYENESESMAAEWSKILTSSSEIKTTANAIPRHAHRKVRFSQECGVIDYIQPASELSEYDKQDIYYDAQDYQRFRSSARTMARMIRCSSERHNCTSYCNIFIQAYSECRRKQSDGLDEMTRKYLEHWTTVGSSRRGLEKWGVKELGARINHCRDKAVMSVLHIQQLVREQEEMDQQQRAEFIRLSYEQITRPARLFGEAMGGADALAAQDDEALALVTPALFGKTVHKRTSVLRCRDNDSPAIDPDYNPTKKLKEQLPTVVEEVRTSAR